jgi:hypothetical protein
MIRWILSLFRSKSEQPINHCKTWTDEDIDSLSAMMESACSLDYIADKLGRTERSVKNRIRKL